MSKSLYEKIAQSFADLSDLFEQMAADGETKPVEDEDEDLPVAKKAGTAGKPKVAAKKKAKPVEDDEPDETEPDETDEAAITEDDLVSAATKLIKAVDRETALAIVKKFGGERIADLKESVYPKVMQALLAAMPKKGAKKKATDDDDI